MTPLAVRPIVELCALDSRLGKSLSESDPLIVHLSATASEITLQTAVVWPDTTYFPDSPSADRRKNSIQTP